MRATRLWAAGTLGVLLALLPALPARADENLVAVTVTATPNSLTIPSTVQYQVTVAYAAGGGTENATVTVTFPSPAISSTVFTGGPTSCSVASGVATCTGVKIDDPSNPDVFTFLSTVSLLALGQFTVTAVYTGGAPADTVTADNTGTALCTAVTSVLVTC